MPNAVFVAQSGDMFEPGPARPGFDRAGAGERHIPGPRKIHGRVIRAEEDCWLRRVFVRPEQEVKKGDPLFSYVGQSGVEEVFYSADIGVVHPMVRHFFNNFDYEQEMVLVKQGSAMLRIAPNERSRQAGTVRGLTPRNSKKVSRLLEAGLNLQ